MPKLKTNKAAAKRFKATATGKLKRGTAGRRHILGKKSRKLKRGFRKAKYADKTNVKQMKRLLPYV